MNSKLIRMALGVGVWLGVAADTGAYETPPPALAASVANAVPPPASRSWRAYQSEHFTLIYAGDTDSAHQHAALLERAHTEFHDAFGTQPFRLQPAQDPLVALYFEDKADYLRYARQIDHVDMSWTLAYYSAKTNRVAFFRYGRSDTASPTAAGSEGTPALNQPDGGEVTEFHTLDPSLVLASATHEAAHQLAFNTGLQQRGVIYPLWASEGLATSFELLAPDAPFGPSADNAHRSARLERVWRDEALRPLDDFISTTRVPTEDARATDEIYAQAWGLFRYLYLRRPEALADYLEAMRDAPRGQRSRQDLRDDFIAAFGPVEVVERGWRHWLRTHYGSQTY